MSMNLLPGDELFTADGQISDGHTVRIFSVHIISGGTAGVVNLRDGQDVSGTIRKTLTGTASDGKTFNFAGGLRFENGCYYDEDANVTSANIVYTREF